MATDSLPHPRGYATICLPVDKDYYNGMVHDPVQFRAFLDQAFQEHPQLFPAAFGDGYDFKDARHSVKLGLCQRRITCRTTGAAFSVRPDFALPYMTAWTDDANNALFLRSFGVPFWAVAHVYGHNPMFWYRMEMSLGRNSIVGTTVRQTDVPKNLLADEHHQPRDGDKNYIATTVAEGCCLGAAVAATATEADLTPAYGVFKQEAENVEPGYRPATVNTDGWAATRLAWLALFPLVVVLRCFLHGWLSVRERGKHLGSVFRTLGDKVWHAYRAENRQQMAQRLRRLRSWVQEHLTGPVLEQVLKLCGRSRDYGQAYDHPQGHRTSNMLDRVMRWMNRYFDQGLHLHGSQAASERHVRAWALVHNFRPWSPASQRANQGYRCPAERLNRCRYQEDWLRNLLVSASMAGYRR